MLDFISGLIPILIGILVFGVLVLIHEWGHFIAAKKCGILVEEFAIGMGPKLAGIQRGDTLFSIRAFPIGGFCRMLGEDDTSKDNRAFNNKSVPQRMVVILAGAAMNLLLAVVLFSGVVFFTGYNTTTVSNVVPGSPAEAVGLAQGDEIIKLDGDTIKTYSDIPLQLYTSEGKSMELVYKRDGEKIITSITPVLKTFQEGTPPLYIMGINVYHKSGALNSDVADIEQVGFFESIAEGYWEMVYFLKSTVYALGQLVSLDVSLDQVAGPIGVVSYIGTTYDETMDETAEINQGLSQGDMALNALCKIALLTAILSASIGIFNLIPFPALDGGRFVFLVIEGIRRKPISPEKEGMVHFVGIVLLLSLGVLIAINDILRIL